jgi:hypothetical protein
MDIIKLFIPDLQKLILSYIMPDNTKYNKVLKELEQLIIYTYYTNEEEDEELTELILKELKYYKYITELTEQQNKKNILNIQILKPNYNKIQCIKHLLSKKIIKIPNIQGKLNKFRIGLYANISDKDIELDDIYYLDNKFYR